MVSPLDWSSEDSIILVRLACAIALRWCHGIIRSQSGHGDGILAFSSVVCSGWHYAFGGIFDLCLLVIVAKALCRVVFQALVHHGGALRFASLCRALQVNCQALMPYSMHVRICQMMYLPHGYRVSIQGGCKREANLWCSPLSGLDPGLILGR